MVSAADARPKTPTQMPNPAWTVLTDAVANKSSDNRIQVSCGVGDSGRRCAVLEDDRRSDAG